MKRQQMKLVLQLYLVALEILMESLMELECMVIGGLRKMMSLIQHLLIIVIYFIIVNGLQQGMTVIIRNLEIPLGV